jgi:hypothetical protein
MDSTTKVTRRQLLAHIALADLPTPKNIQFYASKHDFHRGEFVGLDLDTVADALVWASALGVTLSPREFERDGTPWRSVYECVDEWHGWYVALSANEPIAPVAPVEDLDDATRTALTDLAGVSS